MASFVHPLNEYLEAHPDERVKFSYKAHCDRMDSQHREWNAFLKSWDVDPIAQDELL